MKPLPNTGRILACVLLVGTASSGGLRPFGSANQAGTAFAPTIPKTWDDDAVAALEVPLANAAYSPVHVKSDVYYELPVRPVYKSYPIYAPGREPAGYIDWLQQQEPKIVFDASTLKTESDWIRAGELVFDAPTQYVLGESVRDPDLYTTTQMPLTPTGVMPFRQYVIRKKGVVEVGNGSCAQCHTRVMADGTVVKGAQGNHPGSREVAFGLRRRVAQSRDHGAEILAFNRRVQQPLNFGAPWIHPDPGSDLVGSVDELIGSLEAIPAGVNVRGGTSRRYPPQLPSLIGVKDRRYLDHTGLVRHRSIADLMRYAALNQGAEFLSHYGDFIPVTDLPPGRPIADSRYSDEQLYALALYLYSLEPPPNPNRFDALAQRGQEVFGRAGCAMCHTPPLYTSNKLTPAEGFVIPDEQHQADDIFPLSVGTDPGLALGTRRGTGYYKVPSLKGVWYRGPFEHNGSVATLDDWFDPTRLRDDYVPTGFKGYGVTTRAVKGHPFGLNLSPDDRRALVAFLKTL
jgi:mono/diheme cytochrome c family protein